MASSDDEEWEQAPEEEDSDDADFVPEAPPAPAAIREAYAREQAQAPRAAPQKGSEPDPDDETLDDLSTKAITEVFGENLNLLDDAGRKLLGLFLRRGEKL